ncbi:MAG: AAA family ATPase, partial [Planctomycetota bacterium]
EPRAPSPEAGDLARDLFLSPRSCDEMVAAARQRGQLLLVGPPASGKTHVARRLAIYLAGHEERVLFLRMHPEARYADLLGEPGAGRGWVRELCERARDDRSQTYVLVLDELDRGDAARALGEFVGGLSERGQRLRLSASGAPFEVPRNLVVVGTARGLPHDPALVGRFPVVRQPADSLVLGRFLAACRPGMNWVADLHQALNRRLADQGHSLRVGHGLFMLPDLDVASVRGIWAREVLPLLEAHGVDLAGFSYEALRP